MRLERRKRHTLSRFPNDACGELSMIIFLYGQNSYSLIQYVNELISRYQKKYPDSFNLHRFDLEEDDPAEIRNAIKGISFFNEIKFIIIKNPMAKSAVMEKILEENNIGKQKETVLLLYQNGSVEDIKKKDEKLFKRFEKESQAKEFKPPTIQAANKFASTHLAKYKIPAKKEIMAKLIKETGLDFWRLKNELDKIIFFAKEEKISEITEEDVIKLVNFKIDHNIFDIIDAAFSNQAKALALFENFLADGGDPLYLLSMIAFQLKNMLIVRELMDKNGQYAQILKKTGMHPFFFRKNYEAAKKYPFSDLKKIFQKTADFEIALKTGQAEPENIFFKIFL
ncbi:MAG: DNA polymerase III subunit delta [Parcubacteria group bacterium]|nr:DNA polymerase III subunit delta [Parcubacteria group bacterium]